MTHFNENIGNLDSVLYDMPVSNNGARVRMLLKSKGLLSLEHRIRIRPPSDLGGLKSEEYLALNPQGKMPLYVTERGVPIPESDTICNYLVERYRDIGPSFHANHYDLRALDKYLVRLHDTYLLPIQGCLYKAPGTPFAQFGTDRKAALAEFRRQLDVIEDYLSTYDRFNPNRNYKLKSQFEREECNYLCGNEIQLSDCTLYPTLVFAKFMMPLFFDIPKDQILGPKLQKWWCYMTDQNQVAKETKTEIEAVLQTWKGNGRWDPIMAEMKA